MNWTDRDLATAIIAYTATAHDLTASDLTGRARDHETVHARQVAMYLMRQLTDLSYPQIGHLLGDRNHTTVMHGCRRITRELRTRPRLAARIQTITDTVAAATAQPAVSR